MQANISRLKTTFSKGWKFVIAVLKGLWVAGPAGALVGGVLWFTDKPFVKAEVVLKTARPGDLIEFDRSHYKHWAMLSDIPGEVFNVPAESKNDKKVTISQEKLTHVARGDRVRVNNQERMAWKLGCKPRPKLEALAAAKSDVGKTFEYNFLSTNCEHYCTNWFYGEGFTAQSGHAALNLWTIGATAQIYGGTCGAIIGALFGFGVWLGFFFGWGVAGGIMSGVMEVFGITVYTTNRWVEQLMRRFYPD